MVRGTFANIRLRNLLVPGTEGGITIHLPEGATMPIYDAALRYQSEGVPMLAIAGREYGAGSSRDWAAKGTLLLGVRAVIAETYERIHRSNLVGMGVLPLEFKPGESTASLGLTGREVFDITGLGQDVRPRQELAVTAMTPDGSRREFKVTARLDSLVEVDYYLNGGILQTVLRTLAGAAARH
jgi:aconitate hydratase